MKTNNTTITTPIADFIRQYHENGTARFHMPGHKGHGFMDIEHLDITEITGADALYEAGGIIAESEANATLLFNSGCTVYSAEGSSQCIKAMLRLATMSWQKNNTGRPVILAARNVHKAFVYGAALLDLDVCWLYSDNFEDAFRNNILSCIISPIALEKQLSAMAVKPAAVYITSPDYLGNIADIACIADICHKYNTLLLVDNAHGAYLHFLDKPAHPLDLGADMCCDSAHKTLPALTGAAYLHVSKNIEVSYKNNITEHVKEAMVMFGSTSPSYLIMSSLDYCNKYLAENYKADLSRFIELLNNIKVQYPELICDSDPLRLTIKRTSLHTGIELGAMLKKYNAEYEYADDDYLVLMLTPSNDIKDLDIIQRFLDDIKDEILITNNDFLTFAKPEKALSIHDAIMCEYQTLPIEECLGKICASPLVACPPAIPIVISGEIINESCIKLFKKYNIKEARVVI